MLRRNCQIRNYKLEIRNLKECYPCKICARYDPGYDGTCNSNYRSREHYDVRRVLVKRALIEKT